MNHIWRFIDTGQCSAPYNMALDEAVATAVRRGIVPPTLRIYGWDVSSVSIGCFQKISDIDTGYCAGKNIPVVRRPTGGRAILHGDEITYSFSAKTDSGLFSKGLLDSYRKISIPLTLALVKIGLSPELKLRREARHPSFINPMQSPLCFQAVSYGEITVNSKKLVGSAQKRWSDGLLQQGCIPFRIDKKISENVFKLDSRQREDGFIAGLKESVPGLNPHTLRELIKTSFEDFFEINLVSSGLTEEERNLTGEFEIHKYRSYAWNFRR
jgi:lipoate-protein ligase A